MSLYQIKVEDINNKVINFSDYKRKVLLNNEPFSELSIKEKSAIRLKKWVYFTSI